MINIIEIDDVSIPELEIYSKLNEVQLAHYYEPDLGIFIAESPNVIYRALDAGYEPISLLVEKRQLDNQAKDVIQRCEGIPVYTADEAVLTNITGFALTRGILCAMRRRVLPLVEDICKGARRIAILEDVQNPTNIGAIFRSAAALNIDAVLLTPACSDPLYRRAARVSMGTVFQIPWTYFDKKTKQWSNQGIELLHSLGYKTVALALTDDSVSIDDKNLMQEEKLAIILGTEGDGLAKSTIAKCDYTAKIPMSHNVDSLNVAAASAVAFWQLGNR